MLKCVYSNTLLRLFICPFTYSSMTNLQFTSKPNLFSPKTRYNIQKIPILLPVTLFFLAAPELTEELTI